MKDVQALPPADAQDKLLAAIQTLLKTWDSLPFDDRRRTALRHLAPDMEHLRSTSADVESDAFLRRSTEKAPPAQSPLDLDLRISFRKRGSCAAG